MVKDRAATGIGAKESQKLDWQSIDWQSVDRKIRNLRQRIFRAAQSKQWNKVRSLMKLMLRSYCNLLMSVRKITTVNKGRNTPGVDRQLVLTDKRRVSLVKSMQELDSWKATPAKRVYIPKSNGKQRPLGILTIRNRVAQAIVKNALEPAWEAQFEQHSYGFRPGRSVHDAIQQCHKRLSGTNKDCWILDADVKAAFDNSSHNFVLDRIGEIPGRGLIKAWLKAGYIEDEILNATTSGVPQGGVISPVLFNVTMDGMERLLKARGNYGFIRYADDFVITARTKEALENVKPLIAQFLQERGMELNDAKTRITHVSEGFNFLGFHIRRFGSKCLVKPQKEKVLTFLKDIRNWLKQNSHVEPAMVIAHLNPKLLGWGNFYRHVNSKQVFNFVDHEIFNALWRWCLFRHPNKHKQWVARKYFGNVDQHGWHFRGVFLHNDYERPMDLFEVSTIPISYHVKIRGSASPDDPTLRKYWMDRKQRSQRRARKRKAPHMVQEA